MHDFFYFLSIYLFPTNLTFKTIEISPTSLSFPACQILSPFLQLFPHQTHTTLSHHFPHPQTFSHYQTPVALSHHFLLCRPFLTARHLPPYYITSPSAGLFSLPDTCRLFLPLPHLQAFSYSQTPATLSHHFPLCRPFLTTKYVPAYHTTSICRPFLTARYLPPYPTTHPSAIFFTTLRPQVFPTTRYLPHKVPGGHWRQMAGWTYGKKREEWVIEFASQKQILRIVEQTKHQFCLRFYPVHPFFPLFSISPSPSADWPPGTLCGRYRPP